MNANLIIDLLSSRTERIVAELSRLVEIESPSRDKQALDALGLTLADRLRQLGGRVEIAPNAIGGDNIVGRFDGPAGMSPALILGHFDTVWPIGTLARMPVRRENGRLFGPGVFDMKVSLVLVFEVLEAIRELGLKLARPVTVLFTSDEEIGSPGSRGLIEALAGASAHVLVLEPPLADGSLKTARKGVGRFTVEVEGKAAHAGVAPQKGSSAIVELAHQILRMQEFNDVAAGTTLNVGVIQGGTTPNVVPASALAEVDVRVASATAAKALEQALRGLEPVMPGSRLIVGGTFTRPPMERTAAVAGLFERAREVARELGMELTEGSTGGGSDGNFTAALGRPTLDGLGVLGGGAHADDEHILIDSIPVRAALLAALLLNL